MKFFMNKKFGVALTIIFSSIFLYFAFGSLDCKSPLSMIFIVDSNIIYSALLRICTFHQCVHWWLWCWLIIKWEVQGRENRPEHRRCEHARNCLAISAQKMQIIFLCMKKLCFFSIEKAELFLMPPVYWLVVVGFRWLKLCS